MFTFLNENPTREKIIFLLKKNGSMSIDEISKELGITSMGIRQHLLSLERKGIIEYISKRHGIGRPAFMYKLTEKAEEYFPKYYHKFGINLLRDIELNEGKDKLNTVFKWYKNRLVKELKESVSEKKSLQDKVISFRDTLENHGYLAYLEEGNGSYIIKIHNCPIYKIANEYKELCKQDLLAFREILSKDMVRKECIIDGDQSCTYIIPKVSA
jgi:predicted ArsR family transcriptional regulator